MSNCVDIHNNIVINKLFINSEELFKEIDRVTPLKHSFDDMTLEESTIWWFLGRDNVWEDGQLIIISLGEHRSAHTWRDLRQTAHVIAKYLKPHKGVWNVPLTMTDEFDGHQEVFKYELELKRLD